MAKVTSGYFNEDNALELRFEEPGHNPAAAPRQRSAGNHVMPVAMPPYAVADERDAELQDKQASMVRLQHELEQTRREAHGLELRRAKKQRFTDGRRDIAERLSRNLAKLERELYNAQMAVQEVSSARDLYSQHLELLRNLQLDAATSTDDDLDRAIGSVEDAENEFATSNRRLAAVLPKLGIEALTPQIGGLANQKFSTWLRAGAAFSLPLALAALLVALIIKLLA